MKQVIIVNETLETMPENLIRPSTPIFAKDAHDRIRGMLVLNNDRGWILMTGGNMGSTGYHKTRQECITSCLGFGYKFFIDI